MLDGQWPDQVRASFPSEHQSKAKGQCLRPLPLFLSVHPLKEHDPLHPHEIEDTAGRVVLQDENRFFKCSILFR
jgi:hypothetical protein